MKLNLGAGRRPIKGWVNSDLHMGPGIDLQMDLDYCDAYDGYNVKDGSVEEFAAVHVIEHLRDPLHLMSWAWNKARHDAEFTIIAPHGASDGAWEDPTHVRPYFHGSWGYFSQPYHWMNPQSGYAGDWRVEVVQLVIADENFFDEHDTLWHLINHERNWVEFQHVVLSAVKPAREPKAALVEPPRIVLIPFSVYCDDPETYKWHQDPNAL